LNADRCDDRALEGCREKQPRKPTAAEAPRPDGDCIEGRSPGSRVLAPCRLPGISQWLWFGLAAYSCGGSRGFGASSVPRSLFALKRETVECQAVKAGGAAFVKCHQGWRLARDSGAAIVLGVVGSRVVRDEKGNAVRVRPNAATAPATVSGELPSTCHWGFRSGKAEEKQRPASQETCRRRQR